MSAPLPKSNDHLLKAVHDAYSTKARVGADIEYSNNVARAFGYTLEQLTSIPAESHMGLSCGNPVAAASIKHGEHVLDLGSGGGIDILLAAAKVGLEGRAIGLDMSSDMVSLARNNAKKQSLKPPHVAFVHAMLTEPLPLASDSIDCIISNCVVNLLPLSGKAALFKETYRVLKPGGRIVLDDIVAKKPMPEHILNDLASYVGCIAGAIQIQEYRQLLTDAGFQGVIFVDTKGDLSVYFQDENSQDNPQVDPACCSKDTEIDCCGPQSNQTCGSTDMKGSCCGEQYTTPMPEKSFNTCCAPANGGGCLSVIPARFNVNEWAASYQIYAIKPVPGAHDSVQSPPEPLLRWWDAYPAPRSEVALTSPEEVGALLHSSAVESCAVIDVRRTDHAGGHVAGSFQRHAQTFYDDLPAFHAEFRNKKKVIFYCRSSKGRARRCAGWYQDFLDGLKSETKAELPEVLVMEGGMEAFKRAFVSEKDLIEYDDE